MEKIKKNNKILVLDNYDSFTYNLVHLIEKLGCTQVDVYRNDRISLEDVAVYDKILLSPGPGIPKESGILPELVRIYSPVKSILGVCLGLQAIGEVFGGKLVNLPEVFHGVSMDVQVIKKEDILFRGLPETFKVGRYHSWAVSNEDFPSCLDITAIDGNGTIMALSHKVYDVRAVQFHPESVLTPDGEIIIRNWLEN
jgi:anthranilate synthase component 2